MKRFILPVLLVVFIFLLNSRVAYAGTDAECRPVFDQDMKKCTVNFNACIHLCGEETKKPNGDTYFNSGEIYSKCTKREQCSEKSSDCSAKALEDFWACRKSDEKPETAKLKKESPAKAENEWLNPRDLIYDYLVRESARFNVSVPEYWEIKPEDFVISRGAPKPEGGNIWIVEPRTKVWVKAKGQSEYKPFDYNTTVEPGSYIKTETPVDFWVKGVGLIQLRPGKGTSGMFAVEEINGEISPFLLMGEMEIKYGKPVEEATRKPIDWEQIKFKVRTPNSSVTVSRTHYLVRFDEKGQETTVAVLEGEVKVAPNNGKPVTVTPKDGKPGVVVITQKLSPVKLAIVGVILAVIVGGIFWVVKRKKRR